MWSSRSIPKLRFCGIDYEEDLERGETLVQDTGFDNSSWSDEL